MPETFPPSLQELLNESGFTQKLDDTSIRSSMGIGLPKVRNRYTKPVDEFTCTIDMQNSDYSDLITFYRTTLGGGVKTFYYNHPLSQVQSVFRFMGPPTVSPKGGTWFNVSMQWEEIPQ